MGIKGWLSKLWYGHVHDWESYKEGFIIGYDEEPVGYYITHRCAVCNKLWYQSFKSN